MITISSMNDDQEDEELRCPRCFYYFSPKTKPYILPCNHNMCKKCIDNLVSNNLNSQCPICSTPFTPVDAQNSKVNFAFLNLVSRILKTKTIFCKKCNQICYWIEHNEICDEKEFKEVNIILDEIKTLCQECFLILKHLDYHKNIISSCKNSIYKILYDINNEILINNEKKYKNSLKELFSNIDDIDIIASKGEIVKFLETLLPYCKYFDKLNEDEMRTLVEANTESKFDRNFSSNTLPTRSKSKVKNRIENKQYIKHSRVSSAGSVIENSFDSDDAVPSEKDSYRDKKVINNFKGGMKLSKNSFQNFPVSASVSISDLLIENSSSTKVKKHNRIIVSKKGIQVIHEDKSENVVPTISNITSSNEKKLNKNNYVKSAFNRSKENYDRNLVYNGSNFFTIHRLNNQGNPQKGKKELNKSKTEKELITNKTDKTIQKAKTNFNTLNNSLNEGQKKEDQFKMINKVVKNFNKVRDIINKLKKYSTSVDLYSSKISEGIEYNFSYLQKQINYDYEMILNEIGFSFHQLHRRNLINFFDNTKKIVKYDVKAEKFEEKNFSGLLVDIGNLNSSYNIEFDDLDLVFLSGGYNSSTYDVSDTFLIIRWTTMTYEVNSKMPIKRGYHSSVYFDNKLYVIGGLGEKKYFLRDCEFYSISSKRWISIPSLNYPRAKCSLCLYNNSFLYVFRGEDKDGMLNTIEFINLKNISQGWTVFHPDDPGLCWFGCMYSGSAAIDKDKILIFGGEDRSGKLYHHTFLFNPITKEVFRTNDLPYPCCFRTNGNFIQNEICGISYKSEATDFEKRIHIFDSKHNKWKMK